MSAQPQIIPQPAPEAAPTLLDQIVAHQASVASRYQPVMSASQAIERVRAIKELKDLVLVNGEDYGIIPGTNKPTLLKPGAEKICAFFGYVPRYEVLPGSVEDWKGEKFGEPLFYYHFRCTLQKDGSAVGEGTGSCNSWESKYRYRHAARLCPKCGAAAIILSKYKDCAYLCFAKKGGCGAKFQDGDQSIEGQQVGKVANPDIADVVNTVQKIAAKRSYIAATLSATGASQWFTQDMEDGQQNTDEEQAALAERRIAEEQAKLDKQRSIPTTQTGGSSKPNQIATATASGETATRQSAGTTREIPASSTHGSEVPEGIQRLWTEMGTKISTIVPVFERLKKAIYELSGAEVEYYNILAKHGMVHSNDCKTVGISKTRQAAREMVETLERWAKNLEPPPGPAPQPFQATDDDLPEGLFKQEEAYGPN